MFGSPTNTCTSAQFKACHAVLHTESYTRDSQYRVWRFCTAYARHFHLFILRLFDQNEACLLWYTRQFSQSLAQCGRWFLKMLGAEQGSRMREGEVYDRRAEVLTV
jgi:hypothetical protein